MRHTHVFFSLDDDWLFIPNERVSKNFERPSVEHRCCKMVITYGQRGWGHYTPRTSPKPIKPAKRV